MFRKPCNCGTGFCFSFRCSIHFAFSLSFHVHLKIPRRATRGCHRTRKKTRKGLGDGIQLGRLLPVRLLRLRFGSRRSVVFAVLVFIPKHPSNELVFLLTHHQHRNRAPLGQRVRPCCQCKSVSTRCIRVSQSREYLHPKSLAASTILCATYFSFAAQTASP